MKNLTWLLVCCLISTAATSNPTIVSSTSEPTTILLRIGWEFCQPDEHTFDWSFIDGQLQSARNQGKKISLQIDPLSGMPEWIKQTSSSDPQGTSSINSNRLLTVWTHFIQRLGEKYGIEKNIDKVYITHVLVVKDWSNPASISEQMHGWKKVVEAFEQAFPLHQLILAQPPLAEPGVVSHVQQYTAQLIGDRYLSAPSVEVINHRSQGHAIIAANDLVQWEKWNVSNSVTAQQSVQQATQQDANSLRNIPNQSSFRSNLGKRKPILEKLVSNVSLLGTPVWADIFQ
ncbi:MAG: hypothetical protein ACKOOA_04835 [Sediminibacterium sp.]